MKNFFFGTIFFLSLRCFGQSSETIGKQNETSVCNEAYHDLEKEFLVHRRSAHNKLKQLRSDLLAAKIASARSKEDCCKDIQEELTKFFEKEMGNAQGFLTAAEEFKETCKNVGPYSTAQNGCRKKKIYVLIDSIKEHIDYLEDEKEK